MRSIRTKRNSELPPGMPQFQALSTQTDQNVTGSPVTHYRSINARQHHLPDDATKKIMSSRIARGGTIRHVNEQYAMPVSSFRTQRRKTAANFDVSIAMRQQCIPLSREKGASKKRNQGIEFEVQGERLPQIDINPIMVSKKLSTSETLTKQKSRGRSKDNIRGNWPLSQPTSEETMPYAHRCDAGQQISTNELEMQAQNSEKAAQLQKSDSYQNSSITKQRVAPGESLFGDFGSKYTHYNNIVDLKLKQRGGTAAPGDVGRFNFQIPEDQATAEQKEMFKEANNQSLFFDKLFATHQDVSAAESQRHSTLRKRPKKLADIIPVHVYQHQMDESTTMRTGNETVGTARRTNRPIKLGSSNNNSPFRINNSKRKKRDGSHSPTFSVISSNTQKQTVHGQSDNNNSPSLRPEDAKKLKEAMKQLGVKENLNMVEKAMQKANQKKVTENQRKNLKSPDLDPQPHQVTVLPSSTFTTKRFTSNVVTERNPSEEQMHQKKVDGQEISLSFKNDTFDKREAMDSKETVVHNKDSQKQRFINTSMGPLSPDTSYQGHPLSPNIMNTLGTNVATVVLSESDMQPTRNATTLSQHDVQRSIKVESYNRTKTVQSPHRIKSARRADNIGSGGTDGVTVIKAVKQQNADLYRTAEEEIASSGRSPVALPTANINEQVQDLIASNEAQQNQSRQRKSKKYFSAQSQRPSDAQSPAVRSPPSPSFTIIELERTRNLVLGLPQGTEQIDGTSLSTLDKVQALKKYIEKGSTNGSDERKVTVPPVIISRDLSPRTRKLIGGPFASSGERELDFLFTTQSLGPDLIPASSKFSARGHFQPSQPIQQLTAFNFNQAVVDASTEYFALPTENHCHLDKLKKEARRLLLINSDKYITADRLKEMRDLLVKKQIKQEKKTFFKMPPNFMFDRKLDLMALQAMGFEISSSGSISSASFDSEETINEWKRETYEGTKERMRLEQLERETQFKSKLAEHRIINQVEPSLNKNKFDYRVRKRKSMPRKSQMTVVSIKTKSPKPVTQQTRRPLFGEMTAREERRRQAELAIQMTASRIPAQTDTLHAYSELNSRELKQRKPMDGTPGKNNELDVMTIDIEQSEKQTQGMTSNKQHVSPHEFSRISQAAIQAHALDSAEAKYRQPYENGSKTYIQVGSTTIKKDRAILKKIMPGRTALETNMIQNQFDDGQNSPATAGISNLQNSPNAKLEPRISARARLSNSNAVATSELRESNFTMGEQEMRQAYLSFTQSKTVQPNRSMGPSVCDHVSNEQDSQIMVSTVQHLDKPAIKIPSLSNSQVGIALINLGGQKLSTQRGPEKQPIDRHRTSDYEKSNVSADYRHQNTQELDYRTDYEGSSPLPAELRGNTASFNMSNHSPKQMKNVKKPTGVEINIKGIEDAIRVGGGQASTRDSPRLRGRLNLNNDLESEVHLRDQKKKAIREEENKSGLNLDELLFDKEGKALRQSESVRHPELAFSGRGRTRNTERIVELKDNSFEMKLRKQQRELQIDSEHQEALFKNIQMMQQQLYDRETQRIQQKPQQSMGTQMSNRFMAQANRPYIEALPLKHAQSGASNKIVSSILRDYMQQTQDGSVAPSSHRRVFTTENATSYFDQPSYRETAPHATKRLMEPLTIQTLKLEPPENPKIVVQLREELELKKNKAKELNSHFNRQKMPFSHHIHPAPKNHSIVQKLRSTPETASLVTPPISLPPSRGGNSVFKKRNASVVPEAKRLPPMNHTKITKEQKDVLSARQNYFPAPMPKAQQVVNLESTEHMEILSPTGGTEKTTPYSISNPRSPQDCLAPDLQTIFKVEQATDPSNDACQEGFTNRLIRNKVNDASNKQKAGSEEKKKEERLKSDESMDEENLRETIIMNQQKNRSRLQSRMNLTRKRTTDPTIKSQAYDLQYEMQLIQDQMSNLRQQYDRNKNIMRQIRPINPSKNMAMRDYAHEVDSNDSLKSPEASRQPSANPASNSLSPKRKEYADEHAELLRKQEELRSTLIASQRKNLLIQQQLKQKQDLHIATLASLDRAKSGGMSTAKAMTNAHIFSQENIHNEQKILSPYRQMGSIEPASKAALAILKSHKAVTQTKQPYRKSQLGRAKIVKLNGVKQEPTIEEQEVLRQQKLELLRNLYNSLSAVQQYRSLNSRLDSHASELLDNLSQFCRHPLGTELQGMSSRSPTPKPLSPQLSPAMLLDLNSKNVLVVDKHVAPSNAIDTLSEKQQNIKKEPPKSKNSQLLIAMGMETRLGHKSPGSALAHNLEQQQNIDTGRLYEEEQIDKVPKINCEAEEPRGLKKNQFGQFSNLIQLENSEEMKTRNKEITGKIGGSGDKEVSELINDQDQDLNESSFMLSKNKFKIPSKSMLQDESMSHNLLTLDGNSKVGLSPKYFKREIDRSTEDLQDEITQQIKYVLENRAPRIIKQLLQDICAINESITKRQRRYQIQVFGRRDGSLSPESCNGLEVIGEKVDAGLQQQVKVINEYLKKMKQVHQKERETLNQEFLHRGQIHKTRREQEKPCFAQFADRSEFNAAIDQSNSLSSVKPDFNPRVRMNVALDAQKSLSPTNNRENSADFVNKDLSYELKNDNLKLKMQATNDSVEREVNDTHMTLAGEQIVESRHLSPQMNIGKMPLSSPQTQSSFANSRMLGKMSPTDMYQQKQQAYSNHLTVLTETIDAKDELINKPRRTTTFQSSTAYIHSKSIVEAEPIDSASTAEKKSTMEFMMDERLTNKDILQHELVADDSLENTNELEQRRNELLEEEAHEIKAEMDDFIERFISLYSDLQNIEKMRYLIKQTQQQANELRSDAVGFETTFDGTHASFYDQVLNDLQNILMLDVNLLLKKRKVGRMDNLVAGKHEDNKTVRINEKCLKQHNLIKQQSMQDRKFYERKKALADQHVDKVATMLKSQIKEINKEHQIKRKILLQTGGLWPEDLGLGPMKGNKQRGNPKMEIAHVVTTDDLVKGDFRSALKKIGGDKPTKRERDALEQEFAALREQKLIELHEQRLNDELTSERSTSLLDVSVHQQEDDFMTSKAQESLFTVNDLTPSKNVSVLQQTTQKRDDSIKLNEDHQNVSHQVNATTQQETQSVQRTPPILDGFKMSVEMLGHDSKDSIKKESMTPHVQGTMQARKLPTFSVHQDFTSQVVSAARKQDGSGLSKMTHPTRIGNQKSLLSSIKHSNMTHNTSLIERNEIRFSDVLKFDGKKLKRKDVENYRNNIKLEEIREKMKRKAE